MLILRFDFRLKPDSPATMQELYSTALDMCQWGERNNAATAMFSEHHSSPDGYLPSPVIIAAAAGGAVGKVKTTPLMTVEEGLEAISNAGSITYTPPQ